jgi:phosphoribosylamine--glycine ligase
MPMKVLVVGGGGREHALAWKLAQSPRVAEVLVAPGNAGTATEPKCATSPVAATDIDGLLKLAERRAHRADHGRPGAAAGRRRRRPPSALPGCAASDPPPRGATGRLQGLHQGLSSQRHASPPRSTAFTEVEAALAYVRERRADRDQGRRPGRRQGRDRGDDLPKPIAAVRDMLEGNAFGDAGHRVVVEEFLRGEEASFIVMVDGKTALPMATSQDHKRATTATPARTPAAWAPTRRRRWSRPRSMRG